jgi:hypothetical protein
MRLERRMRRMRLEKTRRKPEVIYDEMTSENRLL